MSKQSDIREGMLRLIHIRNGGDTCLEDDEGFCDDILNNLHSQNIRFADGEALIEEN